MRSPPARQSRCDAPGCTEPLSFGKLMCRAHWYATPVHLRRAIGDAWREGRIRDWSANCLEARNFHAGRANRAAALRDRQLGERTDA